MRILLLALLLIGCENYKGTTELKDHLVYKNRKGDTQVLVIGQYETQIKLKKKSITIKAKNLFESVKIKLKLNKPLTEYTSDEKTADLINFTVPTGTAGQPFGIKGELRKENIEGEVITETQNCSTSPRWDIDCRWQYEDMNRFPNGGGPYSYCNGIPMGKRDVTYRIDELTSTLSFEIVQDEITAGEANAVSIDKNKVVLEVTNCDYSRN